MSRFLCVVPPLAGHINPVAAVTSELRARGHEIAWAGRPDMIRALAGPEATVFACACPESGTGQRQAEIRGAAALKVLWEYLLVPLADAMAPGVAAAIDRFRPDVLLADQQALAGGLVAERLGVRWVTSAATSAELIAPLADRPKVVAWQARLLDGLRRRIGDPTRPTDPRFSPHLVLAYTTADLVGPALDAGSQVRLVGPAIHPRPTAQAFPWDWFEPPRPTLLVALGTANAEVGERFLRHCADAARARAPRLRTVLVDPTRPLTTLADGVLSAPSVPQLDLLARVDAVVCHGGHNTVGEALWHGLPLVVAPIRDDQPFVAQQVVQAGAGIKVRFHRADAERIGAAIDAVVGEPGYRQAARRLARSFRAAGGAPAAADHLERVAAGLPLTTAGAAATPPPSGPR